MKEYKIRGTEFILRYFDFSGDRTPILFIHGLGCAGSFDYVEVAFQSILSGYRKIVVDLLGAGYSDKPSSFGYDVKSHAKYLKEFIEDMGLEEVIIYGHSLGGAVAIELCDLCANKIKKLILSESNLDPSVYGSASWELAGLDSENVETEFSKKIEEYKNSGSTMWTATLRNWLPKAAHEISKNAVAGGNPPWRTTLYRFDFPKCFIFGEKSLPDKDYEEFLRRKETVEVVKNAGHSMAWENPAALAAAIKNCL